MILLKTQRLYLRNVTSEDVPIMQDYRNHEACARYQRGQTKDYAGIAELVERHKNRKLNLEEPVLVAVALKQTNEMIGEIVVMPNKPTISLGYTFHYAYHRKGYAFEALSALIEKLHEDYPEWEFISLVEPENVPSIALLKKLGYEDMGYVTQLESQMFGRWAIPEETESKE